MTLNIVSSFNGVSDPDAATYIEAVEAADGELLEFAVGKAINDFVLGCKADGIWDAIKASCILAGARTLDGALVPLVGAAPTNYNFVAGDYNRKTGLVGNGSSKYIDSAYEASNLSLNNIHLSTWLSTNSTTSANIIGTTIGADTRILTGGGTSGNQNGRRVGMSQSGIDTISISGSWLNLNGASRSLPDRYLFRGNQVNYTQATASTAQAAGRCFVFTVSKAGHVPDVNYFNGRITFYSIGEALDLALLDARVTDLINAFGAAIP